MESFADRGEEPSVSHETGDIQVTIIDSDDHPERENLSHADVIENISRVAFPPPRRLLSQTYCLSEGSLSHSELSRFLS